MMSFLRKEKLFLITLVLLCYRANATFKRTAVFDELLINVFDFKFKESTNLLDKAILNDPQNSLLQVAANFSAFIETLSKEERQSFIDYKKNTAIRYSKIEADGQRKDSPYYLYALSVLNFQTAILKFKNEEYITGAFQLNMAYKQLKECSELFPSFIPAKTLMGAATIIASLVPEKYKWFLKLIGIEDDWFIGIKVFTEAENSIKDKSFNNPEWVEFICIKAFIFNNIADDHLRIQKLYNDLQITPESALTLIYLKVKLGNKLGKTDDNIQLMESIEPQRYQSDFPYLTYLFGSMKLNRIDDNANIMLLKYVAHFKGRNYIKSAYQKLSWYYLINHQLEGYKKYRKNAIILGEELMYEDKQAMIESETDSFPNPDLIKSRLLFDGGYYEKSMEVLKSIKPENLSGKRQSIEYKYREARNLHSLLKYPKAIELYNQVISESKNEKWYYAANSALQLGLIYEEIKQYSFASKYIDLCLSFKDIEYEESIHSKAKNVKARLPH